MKRERSSPVKLPSANFVRLFYVNAEYHANYPMLVHKHEHFFEIIYVYKGSGSYRVGERMYDLRPGNVVICNANVLHGEDPFLKEEVITYCCAMDQLRLPGLEENCLIDDRRRPVLFFEPGGSVEHMMIALHELQESNRTICTNLSNAIMETVYLALLEQKNEDNEINVKNDELVRNVTSYLDENYVEPLTLKELGDRFHMSHYYLAHIFKEETGLSPMKYVMHRKVGEVQNMLMNTEMAIQDIGEQMGFSSSCHLSSVFKKYVGISPMAYRRLYAEAQRAVR